MTRIYIKYFFVALLFISAKSSYAQKIEFIYDYYALYNQYSNCTTKHSITSPWLLNGTFVEYGYGYIGLPAKVGNIDTVSFLYFKGNMVFYDKDYNKLLQYYDTCSIEKDINLSMSCISRIFNSDSLKFIFYLFQYLKYFFKSIFIISYIM